MLKMSFEPQLEESTTEDSSLDNAGLFDATFAKRTHVGDGDH
jgi:hypothetical protein